MPIRAETQPNPCFIQSRSISLIITTSSLHVDIHDSPSQSFLLIVVVTLESKNVVVRKHFIFRTVHDFAFAVTDTVDLLRLETEKDDRRLLILSLHANENQYGSMRTHTLGRQSQMLIPSLQSHQRGRCSTRVDP